MSTLTSPSAISHHPSSSLLNNIISPTGNKSPSHNNSLPLLSPLHIITSISPRPDLLTSKSANPTNNNDYSTHPMTLEEQLKSLSVGSELVPQNTSTTHTTSFNTNPITPRALFPISSNQSSNPSIASSSSHLHSLHSHHVTSLGINNMSQLSSTEISSISNLRSMHSNIQDTIGQIQGKTARILQDQERDLIRAFRSRLSDVSKELEAERKKNESGSAEWVHRCRKLTEELQWLRNQTDKLSEENKILLKEARKDRKTVQTQIQDRDFLIKQLVSVKKENARLRYSMDQQAATASTASASSTTQQSQERGSANSRNRANNATGSISYRGDNEKDSKYQQVIEKLKKQSKEQEKKIRELRTLYTNELENKTELQESFKKCIDGNRHHHPNGLTLNCDLLTRPLTARSSQKRPTSSSAQRLSKVTNHSTNNISPASYSSLSSSLPSSSSSPSPPFDPRDTSLLQLSQNERLSLFEWMMSNERLVIGLFDRVFPRQKTGANQERKETKSRRERRKDEEIETSKNYHTEEKEIEEFEYEEKPSAKEFEAEEEKLTTNSSREEELNKEISRRFEEFDDLVDNHEEREEKSEKLIS